MPYISQQPAEIRIAKQYLSPPFGDKLALPLTDEKLHKLFPDAFWESSGENNVLVLKTALSDIKGIVKANEKTSEHATTQIKAALIYYNNLKWAQEQAKKTLQVQDFNKPEQMIDFVVKSGLPLKSLQKIEDTDLEEIKAQKLLAEYLLTYHKTELEAAKNAATSNSPPLTPPLTAGADNSITPAKSRFMSKADFEKNWTDAHSDASKYTLDFKLKDDGSAGFDIKDGKESVISFNPDGMGTLHHDACKRAGINEQSDQLKLFVASIVARNPDKTKKLEVSGGEPGMAKEAIEHLRVAGYDVGYKKQASTAPASTTFGRGAPAPAQVPAPPSGLPRPPF